MYFSNRQLVISMWFFRNAFPTNLGYVPNRGGTVYPGTSNLGTFGRLMNSYQGPVPIPGGNAGVLSYRPAAITEARNNQANPLNLPAVGGNARPTSYYNPSIGRAMPQPNAASAYQFAAMNARLPAPYQNPGAAPPGSYRYPLNGQRLNVVNPAQQYARGASVPQSYYPNTR